MDKKVIRRWLFEALLANVVLVVPFFMIMMADFMTPALLSLWATGLILMRHARKQNPDVVQRNSYQLVEKFLYFQIINLSFAFFFFPLFMVTAIVTVVTLAILLFKTRKNPSVKVVKWAKYTGLHIFNWALLFIMLGFASETSYEELIFAMLIITFFNGMQAAFFIKLEQATKSRGRKLFLLLIAFAMIISTAWTMFPR